MRAGVGDVDIRPPNATPRGVVMSDTPARAVPPLDTALELTSVEYVTVAPRRRRIRGHQCDRRATRQMERAGYGGFGSYFVPLLQNHSHRLSAGKRIRRGAGA